MSFHHPILHPDNIELAVVSITDEFEMYDCTSTRIVGKLYLAESKGTYRYAHFKAMKN